MKHTKGEWSVIILRKRASTLHSFTGWSGYLAYSNSFIDTYKSGISDGLIQIHFIVKDISEANAKLIASPELLEQLTELLTDPNVLHALNAYWPEDKKRALDAIKKATD